MGRKEREQQFVILYTIPRQPVDERIYLRNIGNWTNDLEYAMKKSYASMLSTLEIVKASRPDATIEEAPLIEPYD
jgi:hypothetical protein